MGKNINKEFGILSTGRQLPPVKSKTNGSLLLDGMTVEYNKPYAVLNFLKVTKYLGVPNRRLKIVSIYEKK